MNKDKKKYCKKMFAKLRSAAKKIYGILPVVFLTHTKHF